MTAHEELRERLARTIWEASRADEGTISATGAKIVTDALLPTVLAWGDERAREGRNEVAAAVEHAVLADWQAEVEDSVAQVVVPVEDALAEIRAALSDGGAADRLRAEVHARWHRALDDPSQEPDGPIRDHIASHDAAAEVKALREAAAEMGPDAYRMPASWISDRADRIERQGDPR